MTHILDELAWRGLLAQTTDEQALREALSAGPVTVYCGFDPTAPSLHHGHLVQLVLLRHLQRAGHRVIALVGGATGLIGDPRMSGERVLNSRETVVEWTERLRAQISRFLDFDGDNPAVMVNNLDWTAGLSAIDFLRDVGKHYRLGTMLAKDTVARRLASEEGISFTEFSYQILQGLDYLELFRRHGCTLQTGGNDQWGNLLSGVELIRKAERATAHALTTPLITKADGTKFGKTEGGAVWLAPDLMTPYAFYQFWVNTDDRDVVTYLKYFTFLTRQEIDALAEQVERSPEGREAQRVLARLVTGMVHGEPSVARAERASRLLFGEEITSLSLDEVLEVFDDVPSSEWPSETFTGEGVPIADVLVKSGLAPSKSEAMRLVKGGGVSVNNRPVTNERERLTRDMAIDGRVFVVRRGARQQHLVRLAG